LDSRLLEYYGRELRYLRELGGEFARDFPKVAGRLGLDAFECADPYVERLLEGFAFLAARVQLRIDAEFPRFTEHLLEIVCPHYLGPTPSIAVAQLVPDDQQGGLADGFLVPRGTSLRAGVRRNETTACEYRTAHEVTLWPVELAGLSLVPVTGAPEVEFPSPRRPKASLRLRLRTMNGLPFSRVALNDLTLFFRGADSVTLRLFELVMAGAIGLAARDPATPNWARIDGAAVRPVGLEDDEALLPCGPRSFQGYRLLHEYFAFPSRFLFAELQGLAPGIRFVEGSEVEILVSLDRHDPALEAAISESTIALYCTPAVNLFPKRADRIHLSDRDHEFHVVPDRARPLDFEVHSVIDVTGYGVKGDARRTFAPFYRANRGAVENEDAAFFTLQRTERLPSARQRAQGPRSSYIGSEVFLSLVDGREGPFRSDLRQLAVETLCTNRDLPLVMPVGEGATDFVIESGAPVRTVRCVAGPSIPRPSQARGEACWRLISHLSLNYLALTDSSESEGASALRELLSLYADLAEPAARRQIQGVRSTSTRPVVRKIPVDGPPTFARGIEATVSCDEAAFEGTSVFVLGLVLSRFLARYVSINSFVETVVRTSQRGEVARWPMSLGRRPVT
jgi:type VI secretion system protein ImpG